MDRAKLVSLSAAIGCLLILGIGVLLGVIKSNVIKTLPDIARAAITLPSAGGNYLQAREQILASGLKPASIPRSGKFNQCGEEGEVALCSRFPELVGCVGMGAASDTCRMIFVAPDRRFVVATTFGWENPNTMTLTGITWANPDATNRINNILAGKPELAQSTLDLSVQASTGGASNNPSSTSDISAGSPSDQQNDPYGAEANEGALTTYKQNRSIAMEDVRNMYFAAGCKVFSTGADVLPFFLDELSILQQEAINDRISDAKLHEDLKAAGQDGVTQSQSSGACDYWHQHPEQVYAVRKLAAAAAVALP